ncbi:hypothetical protein [Noviherbaspirillum suwonense]|nr:hypothetical protein [Noviherbaspirillum suwonense]
MQYRFRPASSSGAAIAVRVIAFTAAIAIGDNRAIEVIEVIGLILIN